MVHVAENTFHGTVGEALRDIYGHENVEREKYLTDTGRWVDFWVEGELVNFAIEVENDFEACFKGAGQAIVYAAHKPKTIPLIITPAHHVDQPEARMLSQTVPIIEV